MTTAEKNAVREIAKKLDVRKVDPRRFYFVNDGAYCWIGDRADLNAADARYLSALHRFAARPDEGKPDELAREKDDHYPDICGRTKCIAASHGSAGYVDFDDLPESWQDGSGLGPIRPLR